MIKTDLDWFGQKEKKERERKGKREKLIQINLNLWYVKMHKLMAYIYIFQNIYMNIF